MKALMAWTYSKTKGLIGLALNDTKAIRSCVLFPSYIVSFIQ